MNRDFVLKVGKNIKKYRQQKGLSQFKLAVEINMTPGVIGNLETGRSDTSLSTLSTIADALDVHPYELLKFD